MNWGIPMNIGRWLNARRQEPLVRSSLAYLLWRYGGNATRTLRNIFRNVDFPETKAIANELVEQGVVVSPSKRFLSGHGQQALAEASEMVLAVANSEKVQAAITRGVTDRDKKDFLVELVKWEQEHDLNSPLLRIALDTKLLEIVACYLGMWPRLHAIGAWLNFPTQGDAKESQLWHRDGDDLRLIKAFIYLNDVDVDVGPFSYIRKTQPFGLRADTAPEQKTPGRVTDEAMRSVIPECDWLACTGPAHTMVLADTTGYHRGGKPLKGNRILITFTYTSGTPLKVRKYKIRRAPSEHAWMNEIQRAALEARATV